MDDRIKMAFTFAADITKQLIALSTAVIGAIVTFGNGVLALKVSGAVAWALGCYGVSAIAGAVTLMALTGQLGSPKITAAQCTPYDKRVRIWSSAQVILFLVATAVFAVAAISGVSASAAPHVGGS
jgi:hypothetical protein